MILAFPCNQFFHQEPGSAKDIKNYVAKAGANFFLFEKSDVNGSGANDVFRFLRTRSRLSGRRICWNFGKFLVSRDGDIVEYYGPGTWPMAMEKDIQKCL